MAMRSFDAILAQEAATGARRQLLYRDHIVATTAGTIPNSVSSYQISALTDLLPGLPSGITAYLLTDLCLTPSTSLKVLVGRKIIFGTFDIGNTTVGTFTHGAAMPARTELNTAAKRVVSPLLCRVKTALAGTQTSITVTYKDQDENTAETHAFGTPVTASVVDSAGVVAGTQGLGAANTDWGATDVTAVARAASSGPTGVLEFFGIDPIALLTINSASFTALADLLMSDFNPVRLAAGDEIVAFAASTTQRAVWGYLNIVGDN